MQSANDDTAVIVQAEHRDAVADIEAIVRVEGVDGVLIGPYDLSASLGLPGAVDHPDVRDAIERVRTACQAAGVPIGIFGLTAEAVRPYIDKGFTMIVAGVDTVLARQRGDDTRRSAARVYGPPPMSARGDRLPGRRLAHGNSQRLLDHQHQAAPDVRLMHGATRRNVVQDRSGEKHIGRPADSSRSRCAGTRTAAARPPHRGC